MTSLETERLILRPVLVSDQTALEAVFCDPEVMRYGPGAQSPDWVREWIQKCRADAEKNGGLRSWAVVIRTTDTVVGYCGLLHLPDLDGRPEVEIGYRLAQAHRGHGYATEAAAAVLKHGLEALALKRLVARVDPHNSASIRVVEKLGMRYEREVMLEGYTYPDRLYAIEEEIDP